MTEVWSSRLRSGERLNNKIDESNPLDVCCLVIKKVNGFQKKENKMNDLYARRLGQVAMFQQLYRMHPTLWSATRITGEKLDADFVLEEYMRINGHRAMPLVIPEVSTQKLQRSHWNDLHDSCAWATSFRAYTLRNQTPITQRAAAVARMEESLKVAKTGSSTQNMFLEHVARVEGLSTPAIDDDA